MKKMLSFKTFLATAIIVFSAFISSNQAMAYDDECIGPPAAQNRYGTLVANDYSASEAARYRGLDSRRWCYDISYPAPCLADGTDSDGTRWVHAQINRRCYSLYPARRGGGHNRPGRPVSYGRCYPPTLARNYSPRLAVHSGYDVVEAIQSRGLDATAWCMDISYQGPCLNDGIDPDGSRWVHARARYGYSCYSFYPAR